MRIHRNVFGIIGLLFVLFAPALVHAQGQVVRKDIEDGYLNLRDAPNGNIIHQLYPGAYVPIPPGLKEGWVSINWRAPDGTIKKLYFYNSPKFLQPSGQPRVDLRPGKKTTIYDNPGCASAGPGCTGKGWVSADSKIGIRDAQVIWFHDPKTGKKDWYLFYDVNFSYPEHSACKSPEDWRDGRCSGWINSDYITFGAGTPVVPPVKPRVQVAPPKPPEVCPPKNPSLRDLVNATPRIQDLADQQIESQITTLRKSIGKCLLKDSGQRMPTSTKGKTRVVFSDPVVAANMSPFDSIVMQDWRAQKNTPKVYNEAGKVASKAELIAVDALARTVYGEMAQCFDNDPRYLDAVGRVALNRAESADVSGRAAGRFMKPDSQELYYSDDPASNLKHNITRVVTKPRQFNVWDQFANVCKEDDRGRPILNEKGRCKEFVQVPNPGLDHALCPGAPQNAAFWQGDPPTEPEVEIWDHALRVATKAVLFPETFKRETDGFDAHYYSSRVKMAKPFQEITQNMNGFEFGKSSCMRFWRDDAGF